MSSPPGVPAAIDELSAPWLEAALRLDAPDRAQRLDVEVVELDVEPLGASVGLLGDLARLRPRYGRGEGPATMIAKLPAADPGGRRVGSMLRAWAREVAFYREVAPRSPGARVAACYAAQADETADGGAGRWVVVLEDLTGPDEGAAAPVEGGGGANPAEAVAAVDALAEFHARWWQSDRRFAWMPGFDTTGVGGLEGAWLDALPLFFERYGHLVPDPTGTWIERYTPRLPDWSDRVGTEPLTVVHADYRLDNLVIGRSDSEPTVTIIDWQTALRGPGAMDLSSFLMTSLTIADRRVTEDDLIARYLDGLAAAGVDVDRGWLERSYDETILWWMGQFASNLARLTPDDPATQRALDTMIERTYTAGLDRDVGRLLS